MRWKTPARQEPTRRRSTSGPAGIGMVRRPVMALLHIAAMAVAILPTGCDNSPYPNEDANAMYSSIAGELTHLDPALTYGGGEVGQGPS